MIFKKNRNYTTINGEKIKKHNINIEFCFSKRRNFGDTLTPYIFDYFKRNFKLEKQRNKKTTHLLMCGSIIGFGNFDAIVWGSGILSKEYANSILNNKQIKYDIRAVRGPLTRSILLKRGDSVPEIYGDPAILLPLIYNKEVAKKYDISIINHYADGYNKNKFKKFHTIDIFCDDIYKIIDEIRASNLVISSALHGIIVAESYGIPTIWLKSSNLDDFKYLDWYGSTLREEKDIAFMDNINLSVPSKVAQPPIDIIKKMQSDLIKSFPFDLWKHSK